MHVQGAMSSLAQECSSPDSRGSSSHALDSPMRGNPVCRICDEVVTIWYRLCLLQPCSPTLYDRMQQAVCLGCPVTCLHSPAIWCWNFMHVLNDHHVLQVEGGGQGMCTPEDV